MRAGRSRRARNGAFAHQTEGRERHLWASQHSAVLTAAAAEFISGQSPPLLPFTLHTRRFSSRTDVSGATGPGDGWRTARTEQRRLPNMPRDTETAGRAQARTPRDITNGAFFFPLLGRSKKLAQPLLSWLPRAHPLAVCRRPVSTFVLLEALE